MGEQTLWDSLLWHVPTWDEIRHTSLFTLANYANIFLLIVFVAIAIRQAGSKIVRHLYIHSTPAAALLIYQLSHLPDLTCPLFSESFQWAGGTWL